MSETPRYSLDLYSIFNAERPAEEQTEPQQESIISRPTGQQATPDAEQEGYSPYGFLPTMAELIDAEYPQGLSRATLPTMDRFSVQQEELNAYLTPLQEALQTRPVGDTETVRPQMRPEREVEEGDLVETTVDSAGLMSRRLDDKGETPPAVGNVPEGLFAPRGPAYRASKVVGHSYYKTPIEGSGPRGTSRRGGDAPQEVQEAAINAIIKAGRKAGMSKEDIALTLAIARHESGFNPDAAAGTTSAHGLGQFVNKTGEAYGLNDENRWDIDAQARALVAHTQDNISMAERKGQGREYVYAYHHDGPSLKYGGLDIGKTHVAPRVGKFLALLGGASTAAPKESERPQPRPERSSAPETSPRPQERPE